MQTQVQNEESVRLWSWILKVNWVNVWLLKEASIELDTAVAQIKADNGKLPPRIYKSRNFMYLFNDNELFIETDIYKSRNFMYLFNKNHHNILGILIYKSRNFMYLFNNIHPTFTLTIYKSRNFMYLFNNHTDRI